ncbi:MAG TPA: sel1 repeat family protein, partial [Flavobacteriales bacterium]|nr:sel1 repeat family protein [Flavobacteriales bacterium]
MRIIKTLLFLRCVIMTDYEKGLDEYKKKDYKASIDIFLPLANQGHADSQNKLGEIYECIYYGFDVESFENGEASESELCENEFGNNELAFKWYQEAALHGHVEAQCNLSIFIYFMLGDSESENEQSVKWCRKSANNGHAEAQARLARFYQYGVPGLIKQNNFLAWGWYEKAAAHSKQSHEDRADYELESIHLAAEFLKSNDKAKIKLAISCLVKYSDLGDTSAKIALANFYIEDENIENVNEALSLYNEVITFSPFPTTIAVAQWNLCLAYMYGTKLIDVDKEMALDFAKAAANNNRSYYHEIANFYRGDTFETDWKKVEDLYIKSSGRVAESDYELAKIYRKKGIFGKPDYYVESFKHCKKAAESGGGYSEIGKKAQYLLAEMYLNGEGTKQNLEKA